MINLAFWLAAANLAQLVFGLVQSAVLGRWLGVLGFGGLGWVLSVAMVADSFAQAGLSSIVVRDIAASPRRDGLILGTAVAVRAGIAALSAAVVWPLAGPWAALLVVAYTGQFGVAAVRAKLLRGPQVVAGLLPIAASTAALCVAAAVLEPSVSLALAILAASTLAAGAGQLAIARRHLRVVPGVSARLARGLLVEAWPLWLSGFVVALMYRVDVFLLGYVLPPVEAEAAIGWLQGATKPVESGHFVLGALILAAFPAFAAKAARPAALRAAFNAALRHAVGYGSASVVAALLLGPWAVRVLYGGSFAPAGAAVLFLAPSLALVLVNGLLASLLTAAGRQRELLAVTGAMLAFKAAADLAVIPEWSFRGCAAVTTLTEALGFGLLWWRSRASLGGRRVESNR